MTSWLRELRFKHRHMKACRDLLRHREDNLRKLASPTWKRRSAASKLGWQRRKMMEN